MSSFMRALTVIMFIAGIAPILALIVAFGQPHTTMITASIPPVPRLFYLGVILYFILFIAIGKGAVGRSNVLKIIWFIAGMVAFVSNDLVFSAFYERQTFSGKSTIAVKRVALNRVAKVVDRGGLGYYAEIDPDGPTAIIQVTKNAFDRSSQLAASQPSSATRCKLDVTVETSASGAERIVYSSAFTHRDYLTYCS